MKFIRSNRIRKTVAFLLIALIAEVYSQPLINIHSHRMFPADKCCHEENENMSCCSMEGNVSGMESCDNPNSISFNLMDNCTCIFKDGINSNFILLEAKVDLNQNNYAMGTISYSDQNELTFSTKIAFKDVIQKSNLDILQINSVLII